VFILLQTVNLTVSVNFFGRNSVRHIKHYLSYYLLNSFYSSAFYKNSNFINTGYIREL